MDRYSLIGQFIRVSLLYVALVILGAILILAVAQGCAHAEYQGNLGPKTVVIQGPPVVISR